jgi:CMP-N,N'-diacetyllegionaminic acid synthase
MEINAIILARGNSKGIPKKNIIDFCGKPLLAWTIEICLKSNYVSDVWVSSDNEEILKIAQSFGAKKILRPANISDDFASSESAWLNAINHLEKQGITSDIILAPQVTSPLREISDIDNAISIFIKNDFDSLFSACLAEDLFFWQNNGEEVYSVNYDYKNRKRKQDINEQIIENGSFYLFKPNILIKEKNRLGGKIGYSSMDIWKMFEIDYEKDIRICSALMREYLIKE